VGYRGYQDLCGFCAAGARVEVGREVRVTDLWVAVDAGQVINPDGVVNQVEGGAIQAASWTLREEVTFDECTVTSRDWDSYPIVRFGEVPEVHVTLLDRPDRRIVEDLPVRYVGFTVPDELFVGYGFDLDERHRNLPDLHLVRPDAANSVSARLIFA